MKGLLMKDFLVILRQMKLFLLIIPLIALIGGPTMSSVGILMGAVLPMTAIAYDEQSKWNELARMMPYSSHSLVLGKYLLGYLCIAVAGLIYGLVQLILAALGQRDMGESLFMLFFSVLCGLLLIAVNTPILLKFGTQKGRLVFLALLGLTAAGESVLQNLYTDHAMELAERLPVVLAAAVLLLNIGSILISLCIRPE